jgi:dihydroorotate dehydrogenase electron transfer subunit
MSRQPQRETIFLEEAKVLSHEGYPGEQYLLRILAPECAAAARPGTFVHLRCDPQLPMRRPISIMRVDPKEGWVELLYKAVGEGTRLLSRRRPGETVSTLGPIGRPFEIRPDRPRPLLIGGGVGMPPMIFLASGLRPGGNLAPWAKPLVILGSEVPFPFLPRPSQHLVSGLPAQAIAAMPLLDDWGIPSRLASLQGYPGCFEGYVTGLARHWLEALDGPTRAEVEVFACGPHPMLAAVACLAQDFDLPCQVSLEEYMACGVGGCAGCVVQVATPTGPAMKRVCVDGPVFDAYQVFP